MAPGTTRKGGCDFFFTFYGGVGSREIFFLLRKKILKKRKNQKRTIKVGVKQPVDVRLTVENVRYRFLLLSFSLPFFFALVSLRFVL